MDLMEILKALFGGEALTFEQFAEKVNNAAGFVRIIIYTEFYGVPFVYNIPYCGDLQISTSMNMIFLKNFSICYCNLHPLIFPPINLNFLIQVDGGTSVSINHKAL